MACVSIKTTWKIGVLFWITITLGLVLPIVVMVAIDLVLNRSDFLIALRGIIPFFTSGWGLLCILHDIPFIALAFLIKSRLSEKNDREPYVLRLSEIFGAYIVTLIVSLWMNLDVWISITLSSPGFSTASLVYFFFPFYGTLAILVGYGGGWLVGKLILLKKMRQKGTQKV